MTPLNRRQFVGLAVGSGLSAISRRIPAMQTEGRTGSPYYLDHVILGCSDLEQGIDYVEERTGVRAVFGGVHPGRGTQNALLSLGEMRYLEIMAPDPKQNVPGRFPGLRDLTEPKIVGWAIHPGDLDLQVKTLRERGKAVDGPSEGSRKRPDGTVLRWRTINFKDDHSGMVPFLIEWAPGSKHPSEDAPKGCSLEALYVEGPEPAKLLNMLDIPGVDISGVVGEKEQLVARIGGPAGKLFASTATSVSS